MADLFKRQAKLYAEARPSYPPQLFQFIASKTPEQELAWDVGTGNGQAAVSVRLCISASWNLQECDYQQVWTACLCAEAAQHPIPRYISYSAGRGTHGIVAPHQTIDLMTVAQAFHWFDHPTFYQHVKLLLKRLYGVLAGWCYTKPHIDDSVDAVFWHFYANSKPLWNSS